MSDADTQTYCSPLPKLVTFFCSSRDNWKRKCAKAKAENKSLKIRLAKARESRDRWKAKAQAVGRDMGTRATPSNVGAKKPVR